MNNTPKIHKYKTLRRLAQRLRDDINTSHCVLLFAYNRTGKTRLSMEFKDIGKKKGNGISDTLYFNAYTEDLFVWHNDLDNDTDRFLKINEAASFFDGLEGLVLEEKINEYLSRYADFNFTIDYEKWIVTFRKNSEDRIKISRGEEKIFIWCFYMAICESVIDGLGSYAEIRHFYIDDPISSLDDNNAIAIACDLAAVLRRAAFRKDSQGEPKPLRTVFSSHHSLFFNVMFNEIRRGREGSKKVKSKCYFLHKSEGDKPFTLRSTGDTPFFHHVATLAELRDLVKSGNLRTYHFNALRSILEKIASFLGHDDIRFCLQGLNDEALYKRALNLLSHGKYSITEPDDMTESAKELFKKILDDVIDKYEFGIPNLDPDDPQSETNP